MLKRILPLIIVVALCVAMITTFAGLLGTPPEETGKREVIAFGLFMSILLLIITCLCYAIGNIVNNTRNAKLRAGKEVLFAESGRPHGSKHHTEFSNFREDEDILNAAANNSDALESLLRNLPREVLEDAWFLAAQNLITKNMHLIRIVYKKAGYEEILNILREGRTAAMIIARILGTSLTQETNYHGKFALNWLIGAGADMSIKDGKKTAFDYLPQQDQELIRSNGLFTIPDAGEIVAAAADDAKTEPDTQ